MNADSSSHLLLVNVEGVVRAGLQCSGDSVGITRNQIRTAEQPPDTDTKIL